jgi:hypothetical protein
MLSGYKINYKDEKYSASIKEIILHKITRFQSTEFNLLVTDVVTAIAGIEAANLLFMASAGILSWIAVGAAFYFGQNKFTDRDQHREKFIEQLAELQDIYEWCFKTGDKNSLMNDETFMRLLEIIAPLTVDVKRLLPNQGEEIIASHTIDISKLLPKEQNPYPSNIFMEILSQPPHCMRFVNPPVPTIDMRTMLGFLKVLPQEKPPAEVEIKLQPRLAWFADLRLRMYGIQQATEPSKKPQENKQQPIDSVIETAGRLLKLR